MREANEHKITKVDGVPLLPLSRIESRFTELNLNQTYYIHCKAGARSLKALNFLRQQGFKYLKSVKGGITAWSSPREITSLAVSVAVHRNISRGEEIDSKVPRY